MTERHSPAISVGAESRALRGFGIVLDNVGADRGRGRHGSEGAGGATPFIEVRVDDLAFFEGEAIVRPVNEDLGATTPLLRRLEQAAGAQLLDQTRLNEPLPVGAAIVTGAGALRVQLLVHAVVMGRSEPVSRDAVRHALTSAMQRVEAWAIKSVAIPPFGLGAGNLEIEESAQIMMHVIAQHAQRGRHPASITLIAETVEEEQALAAAVQRSGL